MNKGGRRPGLEAQGTEKNTIGRDGETNHTTPADSRISLPWFKTYLYDLDKMGNFTATQLGAWLRLAGHQWSTRAPIPDDDALLARITKMDIRTWLKNRDVVLQNYSKITAGLQQDYIMEELQKITDISSKRRAAINKRWHPDDTIVSKNDEKSDTNYSMSLQGLRGNPLPVEKTEKMPDFDPGPYPLAAVGKPIPPDPSAPVPNPPLNTDPNEPGTRIFHGRKLPKARSRL